MSVCTAKLVAVTQPVIETPASNAEDLVAFCARVSSGREYEDRGKDYKGLLKYCMRNKHWSVFEMSNAVVEVKAPRDISRQLLRHRSFSFQEFCISGDSEIRLIDGKGRAKKQTIEYLYNLYTSKNWKRFKKKARVWDEVTKTFTTASIKEVFKTGIKPVYTLNTDGGSSITSTLDHKFLTFDGFKTLSEIKGQEDCFIGMNGQALYKDKVWLKDAKQLSIDTGTGLQGIADMADISVHTIRKWLKKHNLQFTKTEVSSYTPAWNKGLPKEQQPRYGKFCSEEVREKMRKSSRRGVDSEFYKGGVEVSWRKSVALWSAPFRQELLVKQGFKCAVSGVDLTDQLCHVDHKEPVFLRPDLAFCKDNLQVLSEESHRSKTQSEMNLSRKTVRWKKVNSVVYVGEKETYDMEIDHTSHNYVANKFVTHNSQRYSDDIEFCKRELREQDDTNRQNSVDRDYGDVPACMNDDVQEFSEDWYKSLRRINVAKECARVVLPEGLTMSTLYVNGTLRSWLHYLEVRDDVGVTQWEHVQLAREIRKALEPAFPTVLGMMTNEEA